VLQKPYDVRWRRNITHVRSQTGAVINLFCCRYFVCRTLLSCGHLSTVVCETIMPSQQLRHLHWLPVRFRIQYKLSTLCFRSRTLDQPKYFSDTLHSCQPTHLLRSSTRDLMTVPRCKTVFGGRRFLVAAPRVWNTVPQELRNCESETLFILKKNILRLTYSARTLSSQPLMRLSLRFYKLNSGAI